MSKKKLRVGLIGCGEIAHGQHLPYWRELADEGRVEIVGACDIIKSRAEAAVERFGALKAYSGYKRMLNAESFDIIDVCTQNRVHCPATVAGLQSGAHVIVEKPMAMHASECKTMIAAAKKAKRKLMVAQHMRFEAAHEKLKAVVKRGDLGEIYTSRAFWRRKRGIPGWGQFHIKKESLGGPLIDIGVHMMDLCVWLMGCPKPVAASGKVYRKFGDRPDLCNGEWGEPYPPAEFDVEDYATALVRFEGGLTMHVEVSWAANIEKEVHGIEILGDRAGISTNPPGVYSDENGTLVNKMFDWFPDQEGHRGEVRHFTECIERNRKVRVQPEESLRIQKIIDAIYESSKKNKEVRIR
jgi:predicted dehydrogenase